MFNIFIFVVVFVLISLFSFLFFCYFTINKIVFLLLVQCVYVGGERSMENNRSSNKLLKKKIKKE